MDEQPDDRNDAQPWLQRLTHAAKEMQDWQSSVDNIDKAYADLNTLRSQTRDREFALFWSNIQIIGPSIYARPPEPVVTPKFKDRRPLYRTASEFLERCTKISFDMADIDQQMIAARDDLAIAGRAAFWVRYEDGKDERLCYEHVDRKDFLHDPARYWDEVDWVANGAWMKPSEIDKRFGEAGKRLTGSKLRAEPVLHSAEMEDTTIQIWEIWCKSEDCVVWVAMDHDEVLERDKPHLKLDGFFPCPRPAYATLKRRSLIPIPDMLYYKDQLEEVNTLTRRIHALAEAIKVRGFYAGGGDLGAAVERAITMADDSQILLPVPALGELMARSGGDPIVWMPLEMIASTITGLIELRRQVIDDVYQVMGMSDIMRGMSEAGETLGAQRLKQQNSSFRVRDKQNELVRIARDIVRIGAQVVAEEFSKQTLEDMAQMDLPTNGDITKQVKDIKAQAKEALEGVTKAAEEASASGQQVDPQQFEQQQMEIIQQSQAALEQAGKTVTIDQVLEFLKDEKLRPFVLDIETDSTIYPDEAAEKQARAEFMSVFSGGMPMMQAAAQMGPEALGLVGGVFKFALAPYRVGRELEGLIDDFVDKGPEIVQRMMDQQAENPDEGLAASQMELAKAEMAKVEAQSANYQAQAQLKAQELQLKGQEAQAQFAQQQEGFRLEIEKAREDADETRAQTEKLKAETQEILARIGVPAAKVQIDAAKAAADQQNRQAEQAISMRMQQESRAQHQEDQQFQAGQSERDREMTKEQMAAQTAQKDAPDGR